MKREHLYFTVIGAGLLVILGIALWRFWPEPQAPLDPPEVLVQRLESSEPVEQRVRAAQDFIRHGEKARVEVRGALEQHQRDEPEVVAPLVQATMKNRDYRSMPTLLDLLEHEDPQVRGRAGAAIQKILGADFGFRANLPEKERAIIVKAIRDDYQHALPRLRAYYEGQQK